MEDIFSLPHLKISGKTQNIIAPRQGDVGYDLIADSDPKFVSGQEEYIEYDTGVIVETPPGVFAAVFPRSSISKYDLILANSVAVIDPSYRGTIKLRFRGPTQHQWHLGSYGTKIYEKGDKIGQLVLIPFLFCPLEEAALSSTERSSGGFGSTGQ